MLAIRPPRHIACEENKKEHVWILPRYFTARWNTPVLHGGFTELKTLNSLDVEVNHKATSS